MGHAEGGRACPAPVPAAARRRLTESPTRAAVATARPGSRMPRPFPATCRYRDTIRETPRRADPSPRCFQRHRTGALRRAAPTDTPPTPRGEIVRRGEAAFLGQPRDQQACRAACRVPRPGCRKPGSCPFRRFQPQPGLSRTPADARSRQAIQRWFAAAPAPRPPRVGLKPSPASLRPRPTEAAAGSGLQARSLWATFGP